MTFTRTLTILLLSLLTLPLSAGSVFDLMFTGDDEAVAIRLEVPMDSVMNKVNTKQDARLRFVDVAGREQNWELNVSLRGKFRRQRCEYAPLKLDFGKKDLRNAGLEDWDKYKLVSTCSSDPMAKDLVIKEYLAYRIYNVLTPQSFRVQRVLITYVDANGNYPERTEEGFIIEDVDEMAARLGGKEVENALGLPAEVFNSTAEVTHALTQYLFSNGDFSMPLARNLKVVELPNGEMIPVGYDFDFSGWVGAPYASPTSEIGQQSIYQRIYQGYAQSDNTMRKVADHFRERRREVMGLLADFYYLNSEDRAVLQRFAARFFKELNQMNNNDAVLLYDQLRDGVAEMIPPGGEAGNFQSMGK
ncbi:hypothetical protein FUA23_12385 [Neolewinella aurantiaca]|uniref:Uncharacterized protein n=1 Tax=Neolewinella aurantiaca TaxID=2602767 RepID=A0A5C7FFM0_9BACT|nr:hypothetical protein [Neolewinella aurantiaca]TXF89078.1 hypothetical protein FUA23_12385 [Neolewinella aurantiaca]